MINVMDAVEQIGFKTVWEDNEMTTDKSNVIRPDDPDLFELICGFVKKQMEENDPEYDGSSLTLNDKTKKENQNGNL